MSIAAGAAGTGPGTVSVGVEANTTSKTRKDSLRVAGKTVQVTQAAARSSTVGIEGEMSRLSGTCPVVSFAIDGPVDRAEALLAKTDVVTSPETTFSGGSCGDLSNGDKVRLSGTMDLDSRVSATSVQLLREGS